MINISINKKLDYEIYDDFKDFAFAGVDFSGNIKRDHPEINSENYKDYIDLFYDKNIDVLQKSCDEVNLAISENRKKFFECAEKIFISDVSKENYKGYISIFNCNPRFVDSKEFQIFYKKDIEDKIEVTFHEILHFIFFDYCSNNLKEETGFLDKNSGKLWELSEIVNVIILNLPEFRNILEREEKLFYPELKDKFEMIKNIWNKGYDINQFILESLSIL